MPRDAGILAKMYLPERLREDDEFVGVGKLVFRVEKLTDERLQPEHFEQIGGGANPVEPLGRSIFAVHALKRRPEREVRIGRSVLLVVEQLHDVARAAVRRSALLGVGVIDFNDALRLGEGQRLQHQPVDRGENRGVGADAERQREQRGGRKDGALRQQTRRVTKIGRRAAKDADKPKIARRRGARGSGLGVRHGAGVAVREPRGCFENTTAHGRLQPDEKFSEIERLVPKPHPKLGPRAQAIRLAARCR